MVDSPVPPRVGTAPGLSVSRTDEATPAAEVSRQSGTSHALLVPPGSARCRAGVAVELTYPVSHVRGDWRGAASPRWRVTRRRRRAVGSLRESQWRLTESSTPRRACVGAAQLTPHDALVPALIPACVGHRHPTAPPPARAPRSHSALALCGPLGPLTHSAARAPAQ
jgi:hypothetical protein